MAEIWIAFFSGLFVGVIATLIAVCLWVVIEKEQKP